MMNATIQKISVTHKVTQMGILQKKGLCLLRYHKGNGNNSSTNSSKDFKKQRCLIVSAIYNYNEALFERNFWDDCEAMESTDKLKVVCFFSQSQLLTLHSECS